MGINNNAGYGGEKLGGSRYVPPHLRNSNANSYNRSSDSWDDAPRNNRSNDRYFNFPLSLVINRFATFASRGTSRILAKIFAIGWKSSL
jgi:hypothetical protein